jgi:hypothetical protein
MTPSMLIVAALGVASSQAGADPADTPITLSTEATPAGLVVQVVGRSATPVAARYSLDVSSGGNHSVQSGTVRLRAGETAILLTSRVGGPGSRQWTARLDVQPEGLPRYEVTRGS